MTSAPHPSQHRGLIIATCLTALLVCFTALGQGSLQVDSVRYAHIALSILKRNDWLHLWDYFKDAPYGNKPPLLFWILAGLFQEFGFSTFWAKLPTVSCVALALLLFARTMSRHFGSHAAWWSVILLMGSRVFFRAVRDLNFEGILLLAAVCILSSTLNLLCERRWRIRDSIGIGTAVFLLLQSKPPYLLILFFAPLIVLLRAKLLREPFKHLHLPIALTLGAAFGGSWVFLASNDLLSHTVANQLQRPFEILAPYTTNLGRWILGILLNFSPALILGFIGILTNKLRMTPAERILFLLWLLPTLPIIALTAVEPRYAFVSLIPCSIFGGVWIANMIGERNTSRIGIATAAMGIMISLAVATLNLRVHRENDLVTILRKDPTLLTQDLLLCVDAGEGSATLPTRRRIEMLLELTFDRKPIVVGSSQLYGKILSPQQRFVSTSACQEHLASVGITTVTLSTNNRASVVALQETLPESPRIPEGELSLQEFH